jgi:hypothetical protein
MFYYDVNNADTSNGTPGTENMSARALTVANQSTAAIMGMYVSGRMATAGGLIFRLKTMATAGTVGSAKTPAPRHPNAPAASTTWFTAHTVGATPTVRQHIGCSAQGGFGGWFAANPEQAITLKPNGGATGNAELTNVCGLASTNFDWTVEFNET